MSTGFNRDRDEFARGGRALIVLPDQGDAHRDAEARLDNANKAAGQAELVRQAREGLPMRLARDAARSAIERSFAMPLKAAGIDAAVTAKFAGER